MRTCIRSKVFKVEIQTYFKRHFLWLYTLIYNLPRASWQEFDTSTRSYVSKQMHAWFHQVWLCINWAVLHFSNHNFLWECGSRQILVFMQPTLNAIASTCISFHSCCNCGNSSSLCISSRELHVHAAILPDHSVAFDCQCQDVWLHSNARLLMIVDLVELNGFAPCSCRSLFADYHQRD